MFQPDLALLVAASSDVIGKYSPMMMMMMMTLPIFAAREICDVIDAGSKGATNKVQERREGNFFQLRNRRHFARFFAP